MSRVPEVTSRPPPHETAAAPATPLPDRTDPPDQTGNHILLTLGGPIPFRGGLRKLAVIRWFPAMLFALALPLVAVALLWVIPPDEWPDTLPLVALLTATALAHGTVLLVRLAQGFHAVGMPDARGDATGGTGQTAPHGDRYRVSLPVIGRHRQSRAAERIREAASQAAPPSPRGLTINWSGYEHLAYGIYLVGGIALLALEAAHHH